MASFPSSVKTFTTRSNGDTITTGFFNDIHDEVTAVETFLRSSLFSAVNSSGVPIWTAYSPVWGNTGTANTTTGSTLTGSYLQMGKIIFFELTLTWGGGTAAGSGIWSFTLPAAASSSAPNGIVVTMADVSAGQQYRGTTVANSTTGVYVYTAASPIAAISATSPFTWATTDFLTMAGWYIAA